MRKDMNRLIIEDGRHGNGGPRTCWDKIRRAGEEFENLPTRESMSRHRKIDCNSLGDRLMPLKRYLESNVGRPWAKVYSEICEVNDRRTLRGHHLFTHLWQYVLVGNKATRPHYDYHDFKVGEDGILKKHDWRKTRRWWRTPSKPVPVTEIKLEDGWKYEKIKDIWFHVHVSAIEVRTPSKFVCRTYGTGTKHERTYTSFREGKTTVEFVQDAKRQCNKKEVKKIQEMIAAGRR